MRINSMKLTVVIILAVMISAIIAALFLREIPEGNLEVTYIILGSLLTIFGRAIADLFKKES